MTFKENNRNFTTAVQETRKQRSKALNLRENYCQTVTSYLTKKTFKATDKKVSKNWPLMYVSSEKLREDIFPQN